MTEGLEERVARLEALHEIRQLACRYAFAVDVLERPTGADRMRWPGREGVQLPHHWPTWERFWAGE